MVSGGWRSYLDRLLGLNSEWNHAWLLDPVNNVVIIFSGLEKEGPTLVALCVLFFSSLAWRLVYEFFYIIFPSRPSSSRCARFDPTS